MEIVDAIDLNIPLTMRPKFILMLIWNSSFNDRLFFDMFNDDTSAITTTTFMSMM